jgi:Mce-associated membrane protein
MRQPAPDTVDPPGHELAGSTVEQDPSTDPTDAADPTDSTDPTDPTDPTDSTDQGATAETRRRVRLPGLPVLALAVTTTVLLAGGTVLGLALHDHHRAERQRAEAVQVARQQVLNLTTLDHRRIDDQLDQLLGDSTGDFRTEFEAMVATFADTVRKGRVNATGVVAETGIVRIDEESARVIVASSAQVTNTAATAPESRQYRMAVDLRREGDRWLVSGMEFVP